MTNVTINENCDICVDSSGFQESPSGVNCTFIRFGTTGLKCYRTKRLRDRSYANQLYLSELGFAPTVGMKTVVTVNEDGVDCTYYAHETQVLTDVLDRKVYDNYRDNCEWDKADEFTERFDHAAWVLSGDLPDNVIWNDSHCFNVGFDDSGQPMIIDCADDLLGDGSIDHFE